MVDACRTMFGVAAGSAARPVSLILHRVKGVGPDGLRDQPRAPHTHPNQTSAEVVADKGCHKTATLVWLGDRDIRAYVAPRRDERKRRWDDNPEGWEEASREN